MHLDHRPSTPPFLADNCGIAIAPEVPCSHGDAAFALHLLGTWHPATGRAGTTVDVLLPRCVSAQMVGALTAFIAHHEGHDAAETFRETSREAFHATYNKLQALAAQGRDCCEAAFRTGAREHTCGRNEAHQ